MIEFNEIQKFSFTKIFPLSKQTTFTTFGLKIYQNKQTKSIPEIWKIIQQLNQQKFNSGL